MSRIEKLIAKFKENPESLSIIEIIKLLEYHGYVGRSADGSHRVYTKPGNPEHITLAIHNNKLKVGYASRYKKILYPND